MNIKRILFPTDFSHCNDAALKFASSLASETGATLFIVHVHDTRDLNAAMGEAGYLYLTTWEEDLEKAQQSLRAIVPTVAGLSHQHECLIGSPASEILKFAEMHDIDLIVMASHGRSGLSRLLLGSVAEGVMRKANCPVLVVKQPIGDWENRDFAPAHAADNGTAENLSCTN
jgi:nucleotide-binding universal stress UspA family protein